MCAWGGVVYKYVERGEVWILILCICNFVCYLSTLSLDLDTPRYQIPRPLVRRAIRPPVQLPAQYTFLLGIGGLAEQRLIRASGLVCITGTDIPLLLCIRCIV